MRLSTQVKPISYVRANAAQILEDLADGGEPVVITQNGEAKAIIQDIVSYEQTQETLAMMKLIAMGMEDVRAGRTRPAREVIDELRAKHSARE